MGLGVDRASFEFLFPIVNEVLLDDNSNAYSTYKVVETIIDLCKNGIDDDIRELVAERIEEAEKGC